MYAWCAGSTSAIGLELFFGRARSADRPRALALGQDERQVVVKVRDLRALLQALVHLFGWRGWRWVSARRGSRSGGTVRSTVIGFSRSRCRLAIGSAGGAGRTCCWSTPGMRYSVSNWRICWTPSCWGCHCGGGGGAAILARSVRAPRCDAGGCRLRVWTVNLQPTALRKEKFSGFHGDDYADYAVVHSRFKRAIRAPLSPARLSPHCAR